MKQIIKQSMKELINFALEMPVGELEKYGTLFLSGPVVKEMSRGELIALQLIERASYGDLEAVKEIRHWIAEDPKVAPVGGDTYFQFLIQAAGVAKEIPQGEIAPALQKLARTIQAEITHAPPSDLLGEI